MARTKQTARKASAGKAPAKPAPKKAAPAAKTAAKTAAKGKAPAQKAPGSKPAAKPAPKTQQKAPAKKVATKPAAKTAAAKKPAAKMEKVYSLTEKQIQTIVDKMLTEQMAKLVPAVKGAIVKALVAAASPSDEVEIAIGAEEDVEEETEDVEEEEEAGEKQEVKEGVSLPKEASKMSVKELKDFAAENEIELPKKGSGNKGVMVKQDYVDFFADYPVDEEEEKPKKAAPGKAKAAPKKEAKPAAKKPAAKKAKPTPKPKTTPLKVAGKKLVVKLNEELGVYTDGDNHVYDEKSHSVYGMVEDDKVRPLKVAEAKALEKKKIALYHVKVLKREVGKVTTKKEVDELVNANAETEVDEDDEDKDVEEDDEDIELEDEEDEEVDEEEDKKREKEEVDEDGGVFEIDEEDLEEEEEGEEDGEEESGDGEEGDVVSETEKNVDETVDESDDITEAQFAKYVKMQYSGASMSDTPKVVETTGLTEDQVQNILLQYKALNSKYSKVVATEKAKAEAAKKSKPASTANQKKRLLTKK